MATGRGDVAACSAVRSTRRAIRCCRGGGRAAAQRTAHRLGAVCGPSAARSWARVLPWPGLARRARARNSGDWFISRCAAPKSAAGGQVARDIPARRTPALSWRSAAWSATSGCWASWLLWDHRSSRRWKLEVCPLVCMRRRRRLGASGGGQRSFFEAESWGLGPNSPSRRALYLQRAEAVEQLS